VRGDAFAEKRVLGALAGSIEELRRQQDISGRVLLLQTADSGDANDPANVERTQGVNVRPVIQLVRQEPMAAAMTRKKVNLPAVHSSAYDRVGRLAERRFDPLLGRIFHAFHLVEAASADDPNGRRVFSHSARLN